MWCLRVTTAAASFLGEAPSDVALRLIGIAESVAEYGPFRFPGGGYWEAMRGDMRGWFELRCTGPRREQFRLFCLLENGTAEELAGLGLDGPTIAVVTGLRKPHRTVFSSTDYSRVQREGDAYRSQVPRRALE